MGKTTLRKPGPKQTKGRKSHPTLWQSFKIATRGLVTALYDERNLKIILLAAIVVTLGSFFPIFSTPQRLALIISSYTVLALELLNTAIEKVIDLFHPEFGEEAGKIKDIAAAAVWVASIGAVIVAGVVVFPITKMWIKRYEPF